MKFHQLKTIVQSRNTKLEEQRQNLSFLARMIATYTWIDILWNCAASLLGEESWLVTKINNDLKSYEDHIVEYQNDLRELLKKECMTTKINKGNEAFHEDYNNIKALTNKTTPHAEQLLKKLETSHGDVLTSAVHTQILGTLLQNLHNTAEGIPKDSTAEETGEAVHGSVQEVMEKILSTDERHVAKKTAHQRAYAGLVVMVALFVTLSTFSVTEVLLFSIVFGAALRFTMTMKPNAVIMLRPPSDHKKDYLLKISGGKDTWHMGAYRMEFRITLPVNHGNMCSKVIRNTEDLSDYDISTRNRNTGFIVSTETPTKEAGFTEGDIAYVSFWISPMGETTYSSLGTYFVQGVSEKNTMDFLLLDSTIKPVEEGGRYTPRRWFRKMKLWEEKKKHGILCNEIPM